MLGAAYYVVTLVPPGQPAAPGPAGNWRHDATPADFRRALAADGLSPAVK
jgi:hypothetical protein